MAPATTRTAGIAAADEAPVLRNRAERLVRERLAAIEDVYVQGSSWRRNGADPQPMVAVIARDEQACEAARRALAEISGLTPEQWRRDWIPLSLGDFMIRLFPQVSAR